MPTHHLPDHPHPDHLRHQARRLQREVRAGRPDAVARVEERLPGGAPTNPGEFRLHQAQLVIARDHGFPSWPRLVRYLRTVAAHRWDSATPTHGPVEEFCRLACLTYSGAAGPERWARAREMRAADPDLTSGSISAAAAAADHAEVTRLLRDDPSLAARRGTSQAWGPLFTLAYSRLDPEVPEERVLGIAEALLEAGADPHEGYLWDGGPSVFTVLTGVFGEGEQGPRRQPRHPHSIALARMLLEAGADPVDHQTLYNRQFLADDDHLELLLAYGLGSGDRPGPWRERMNDVHHDRETALRIQLRWAIEHRFPGRVRLLGAHGVDVLSPFEDGRTPLAIAEMYGGPEVISALHGAGAEHPDRTGATPGPSADALIAAAFRADRTAVGDLARNDPGLVQVLRERGANLLPWAASAEGRSETVRLLVGLGLDVDARGRSDVPVDGGWREIGWGRTEGEHRGHTALHVAAHRGDLELVQALLELGADPDVLDTDHHATALGWAEHAAADGQGRSAVIDVLGPLTGVG
ncbi:ankyrin repeat domain-containing protein [Brachybacterium alimentarium]|uniref:ankyrin repeat domain-containing protein n=1 Tax=Brachybacterium alimentarium TaxID=47845 RepID=UPI003FD2D1FF